MSRLVCTRTTAAEPGRARAGYLLLEVLVALALMAFGLGAVLSALRVSLSAAERARRLSAATCLAQRKLAEVRALGLKTAGLREGGFGTDWPDYRWRTTVTPVQGHRFYATRVEVYWQERSRSRTVTLWSLLAVEARE